MIRKILVGVLVAFFLTQPVFAVSDPLAFENSKVGINILSPESEVEEAAKLVNSGGDWGWVVVIIKKSERNVDRWQSFLNLANKNHVIPIIRLATDVDSSGNWQTPTEEDAANWADFFSKLHFPTKNKYVQIYNEVNHAGEWGGKVNPGQYAKELVRTIDALKAKSEDFFVLNSPLDLAVSSSATSLDAQAFYEEMERTSPGIFLKLDGWASHSYPNPNFSASPYKSGRTGIDGFEWELATISDYLHGRDLPVFITETGWRRSKSLKEEDISMFYKTAFSNVWNDSRIVMVSPFVFDYPDSLYNEFSFKADSKVLGKSYYDYYFSLRDLPKNSGKPQREDRISQIDIKSPNFIVLGSDSLVNVRFRNSGNHIWDKNDGFEVKVDCDCTVDPDSQREIDKIYPGQEVSLDFKIKSKTEGKLLLTVSVFNNGNSLGSKQFEAQSITRLSLFWEMLRGFL